MKKAFTLAEVLIVLAVVGVVAALTMPNLIASYQLKVLETRFNVSRQDLSNRIDAFYEEFPEPFDQWAYVNETGFTWSRVDPIATTLFANLAKSKAFKDLHQVPATEFTGMKVWNLTKDTTYAYPYSYSLNNQFMLPNGALVVFSTYNWEAIYVTVDTNGHKSGPNRAGFDIFNYFIYIKEGKLRPMTKELFGTALWCDASRINSGNGYSCAENAIADTRPGSTSLSGYWKSLSKL